MLMSPGTHGVLWDGIAGVLTLKAHRETLQGRPKVLKGRRSQRMRCAYPFTLARRGVVATMDLSASNLDALRTDHWLSNPLNVKVLRLSHSAWASATAPAGSPPATVLATMSAWSANEVFDFLKAADVEGPARCLFSNGVRGKDFADLTTDVLVTDLRLSQLAARNVLAAREDYLTNPAT